MAIDERIRLHIADRDARAQDKQRADSELREADHRLKDAVSKITGIDIFDLTLARHWECPTSPTEKCIYDRHGDLGPDWCVYCNEPLERK